MNFPSITLLLLVGALAACDAGSPSLAVREAWSRPTASAPAKQTEQAAELESGATEEAEPLCHEVASPGVVYLSISNTGKRADRLLAVRSPACRVAELHETRLEGDRMSMVMLPDGVEIPAGSTVEFAPGGLHIMLLELHEDLLVGQTFDVELDFQISGTVRVQSEVRKP